MNKRAYVLALLCFVGGFAIGGYLFSQTQQRQFFKISACSTGCLSSSQIAGLAASVGIQNFSKELPKVVLETDKSIVFDIQDQTATQGLHYVIVPKKDIPNIADVTADDQPYLIDAFQVMNSIIQQKGLTKYRITTNGPGYQQVAYLHFHLISEPTAAK